MDLALCRQGTAHLRRHGYFRFSAAFGRDYARGISALTVGKLANRTTLLLIEESAGNATLTFLASVQEWPASKADAENGDQLVLTSVREFGYGCFKSVRGATVTGPHSYTYFVNFTPEGLLEHSKYKQLHAPYENYAIYGRGCLGFVSIEHDTVTEEDRVVAYTIDELPALGFEEDVYRQQPCFNHTVQQFTDAFPFEMSPDVLEELTERFITNCTGG